LRSKIFLFLFLVLGIIGFNTIFPVGAITSQWFPSVGTTSEYSIANYLTKWDYTRGESNTFNIYNFSGNKYIVSSYMDLTFPPIPLLWDSVENDSQISVLIDYTERSSTELYKNARIKIDNTIYNNTDFKFVGFRNLLSWLTSDMIFSTESNYLNINSLPSSDYGAFYDYIDNSLGVGSTFPVDIVVISVSQEFIIASSNSLYSNHTYLASSNGRVISYTLTFFHPMMTVIGHRSTAFVFTLQNDSSLGIPGFEVHIILGILGIISAIFIKKKSKPIL